MELSSYMDATYCVVLSEVMNLAYKLKLVILIDLMIFLLGRELSGEQPK